ncbi:AIPR family protein [Serratia plymuthica]|uniref:AIPR family protein n=1 Tax=Serratia plymuthica TaxID=82996 RepID=UPI0018E47A6B|nr:AIPR family protein [Serratia plymuthica]MBI6138470.1 AIPR family protein [Serratia plymuthica]
MDLSIQEFFHDFRQELLSSAEVKGSFQLSEFMESVTDELIETGFVEGFEICHYRAVQGMRIDGYWFNDDEEMLDLFVADFDCRNELVSLTKTEAEAAFNRGKKFFEACALKSLHQKLEVTSPEYGLARRINDRMTSIRQVNFHLLSERVLSGRIQNLASDNAAGIPATYNIWDISRLQRQRSARGHKEPLDLDFQEMFGAGIACLPAHTGTQTYKSYLVVIPADILASLYGKFGARLLEQNVRCFLQSRGKVNQGIRRTILSEPQMFFAYNNGISATAQEVNVEKSEDGLQITHIRDLQIVNGGQTTASLFHTERRDKAVLNDIFVQMKLTVIDSTESDDVVPKISEYANTQNRVNAADFFSNHPFHTRIEAFSRRLWAPASQGAQRESRWFYERVRGQYIDAQVGLSLSGQKRFKAENPKLQMFTKTDLAKFENVWDDHPKWVNLGAQKNFARYAERIGKEWAESSEQFNEFYFRRIIARAIIFRTVEKLISEQSWYNGGYRANIVAYSIAALGRVCKRINKNIDFQKIWSTQSLSPSLVEAFRIAAEHVNENIIHPPVGISNISEWCKKEQCWTRLESTLDKLTELLPEVFFDALIFSEKIKYDV